LFEGINVNVTLLFSISAYEAVAEAYLHALERRLEAGLPVDNVASVASFFLSRIDVLVDRLLGDRIRPRADGTEEGPEALLGRAAVANGKLAYESFERILAGERWAALRSHGARPQRMLWASTSTKNPLYGDVRYVEPLIGPHTVNTMPEQTIVAFADHGSTRATVGDGRDEARAVMDRLAEVGIDFARVTEQLLDEGVRKFIAPFDKLMTTLAERRQAILGGCLSSLEIRPGHLGSAYEAALDALDGRQAGRRLAARDPRLWSSRPEDAAVIRNRLGWLDSPREFAGRVDELTDFAREVVRDGMTHVVLLGMGGSSLSAEVSRRILGSEDGWPELVVLDDTDPASVRAVEERVDLERTLFLVASKSGTTVETLALYGYFFAKLGERLGGSAGSRFAAITDPGTPLAREAGARGFRRCFENPTNIGGRYSALSYFGLVPMALLGADVGAILARALDMVRSCDGEVPSRGNPAIRLGALLGVAGRHGRDKVTFVPSESLGGFGTWAEQLLAESTGKRGRGLIPVVDEPPADDTPYGEDRVFVHLGIGPDPRAREFLDAREAEGHPVVSIQLDEASELGAEYFRWEAATATAGSILGINAFDEPNVAESKRNTKEILVRWQAEGRFDETEPAAVGEGFQIFADAGAGRISSPSGTFTDSSATGQLREFLAAAGPGDYVALLPYFRATPEREAILTALRRDILARSGLATTLGHGPRYLHSTGQLHKGGPDGGLYLLLTAEPEEEAVIPGEAYGFGTLQRAQALGDFRSLSSKGRRVRRIHFTGPVEAGLERLREAMSQDRQAVGKLRRAGGT
ncbi:MAG: bifunctional transaldolase/phosoglucose isomerase, partial [Gemmatimonadota bacterium]